MAAAPAAAHGVQRLRRGVAKREGPRARDVRRRARKIQLRVSVEGAARRCSTTEIREITVPDLTGGANAAGDA